MGLDQLGNTLTGGHPDETISARVGRLKKRSKLAWALAKALNAIDKDHVENAILSERSGTQQDLSYDDVYDLDDYDFGFFLYDDLSTQDIADHLNEVTVTVTVEAPPEPTVTITATTEGT